MSTTRTEDSMRWGRPATDLVEEAHRNQLAIRYEVSALEAAIAAGRTTTLAQYEYALEWLSRYAARRVMDLSADAARARDAAGPATPPPPRPQGVAGHPPARESRK